MKSGDSKYKTVLSDMFVRVCNKHKHTMNFTIQEKVKWVFTESEFVVSICNTKSEKYILETFGLNTVDDIIKKIQDYIGYCSDETLARILIDRLQQFKVSKKKVKKEE